MAGALDLALAGPRRYGGEMVMEPSLNASGRSKAGSADIEVAIKVFYNACNCLALVVAMLIITL